MNREPMTAAQWTLLILLIVSIFINYIDRGSLSIAAPLLVNEMGLQPAMMGALLSAFFWSYALFQLFGIAGWLADRYPVGIVLAAGFALWTIATALTGAVYSFTALFAVRLLLGAGESVAYPCYSNILASDIPQHHRGLANALIDAGSKMGPALGTFIGGLLIARVGWRAFFVVLGVAGLFWLIPWLKLMPKHHSAARTEVIGSPSMTQILEKRSAWGSFFGHFCGNYYWFFLLTWLPSYLVTERKFSLEQMAQVGSLAYLLIGSATVVAGWLSDRWIARGISPTRVRKGVVIFGLTGSTIILPVAIIQDTTLSIVLLLVACMSYGTYTSNHWAITQTLAGPPAAGRWTSLQNGVGNLSGIAAPWFTGIVVQQTGSFHLAFVVSAVIALMGAFFWGFVVGPVKQVQWRD